MPVHKDKDIQTNPWYFAFEVKDPETGSRRVIKKRGFASRKEADDAECDARSDWNKGKYVKEDKTPFGEYMDTWLDNKRDLSIQALYNNKNIVKNHVRPLIGHYALSKISATVIETFVTKLMEPERGLSSSTIRKIFNLVNSALNAAVRRELISKNPVLLLDSKPQIRKQKVDVWTVDEANQFLDSFDNRYKIAYKMAIYLGMRMGEIIGLARHDVDLVNRRIHIRQTVDFLGNLNSGAKTISGNRSVTIPDALYDDVVEQYQLITEEMEQNGPDYNKDNLFICNSKGNVLRNQQLRKSWYVLLENSGVRPIRFHDLRHTCASLLLSMDTHPKVVQEILGHSSIKITLDLYSHMMPNMQSDAINALGNILSKKKEVVESEYVVDGGEVERV